jgi:predicted RND superfamily exporter protein
MDIFSKTKPELISHKALKHINKTFQVAAEKQLPDAQWNDNLLHFYTNYIRPNLFILIVLFIVIIFLLIRYSLKQEKEKDIEKYKEKKRKHKKKKQKKSNHIDQNQYSDESVININDTYKSNSDRIKAFDHIEDPEQSIYNEDNSIYNLENEYMYALNNNDGALSDQAIKDIYEDKSSKISFDELAKIITGSD